MKYEHSDILLLEPFSKTKWKGRFAVTIGQDIESGRHIESASKLK